MGIALPVRYYRIHIYCAGLIVFNLNSWDGEHYIMVVQVVKFSSGGYKIFA